MRHETEGEPSMEMIVANPSKSDIAWAKKFSTPNQ